MARKDRVKLTNCRCSVTITVTEANGKEVIVAVPDYGDGKKSVGPGEKICFTNSLPAGYTGVLRIFFPAADKLGKFGTQEEFDLVDQKSIELKGNIKKYVPQNQTRKFRFYYYFEPDRAFKKTDQPFRILSEEDIEIDGGSHGFKNLKNGF